MMTILFQTNPMDYAVNILIYGFMSAGVGYFIMWRLGWIE